MNLRSLLPVLASAFGMRSNASPAVAMHRIVDTDTLRFTPSEQPLTIRFHAGKPGGAFGRTRASDMVRNRGLGYSRA